MKKTAIILILAIAVGMLVSACNKKVCPAYRTDVDTEQVETRG